MALQIRRGTDSQRQGITPAEGELIYTTDTDKLYIGDGSTAGGIEVSGGVDSAAISAIISASSIDAAQLDGQNPSYYLDYTNLTNTPSGFSDSSTVDGIITAQVNKSFVDALNVDADTLDGQDGAYYLNYTNFSNTPTIPTNNNQLTNGASYVTQAAIDSAVTALIGGAPGALDTLNELAAAINDDASFASSITTSLGTKLNKAGDTLTGTLVSQHVQPTTDNTYDLGSPTKRYRDLYLGPGSLYINNKKVIEDVSGTITVKTDSDQNLNIKTLGTGQTTLQSAAGVNITSTGSADVAITTNTGNIELNGDVLLNASNSINSTTSDPINFGDNIDLNSNKIVNVGTPTSVTDAVNKTYVDNLNVSTFTNDAGYITSAGTDSSTVSTIVNNTVDSSYVQARQTAQDFAYGSLTGTPTIPTNNNQLTNGAGYLTSYTETNDLSSAVTWANVPNANITQGSVTQHQAALSITESQISDLQSYLTSVPAQTFASLISTPTTLSGYGITDAFDGAYSSLSGKPNILDSSDVSTIAGGLSGLSESGVTALVDSDYVQSRETAQDFAYGSLTGAPTIPTNNNQLTNGAGYITGYTVSQSDVTGHQAALSITESQISDLGTYLTSSDLSNYRTATQIESMIDSNVNAIVDAAPGALDTLNELAAALGDDANFSTTITNQIAALPDSSQVSAIITADVDAAYVQARQTNQNFAYSALTGTPTTLAGYGITDAFDGAYGSLSGAPNVLDSSDVATIAGSLSGMSSEGVTALVDSSYVQARQDFAYGSLTGAPTIPTNNNQLSNGAGYITSYTETNDLSSAVTWANVPNANITESSVTQHQAALSITESQISDLQSYLTSVPAQTFASLTGKPTTIAGYGITDAFDGAYGSLTGTPTIPTNNNQLTNGAGYLTSYTETNDLSSAVTWANIPNANVPQSAVTQHQAALSITESQISDLGSYLTSVPAQSFASLTSKPTTIAGYGITDAFDGTYGSLTGTPTIPTNNNQLTNGAGYLTNAIDSAGVSAIITADVDQAFVEALGISAGLDSAQVVNVANAQGYLTSVPAQSFSSLTGKPTTLSGYGITDGFDGAYGSLSGTPTIPTNNNQLTNGAGFITGYTVTQSDVTGHQAALSITESQISDLGTYLTSSDLSTYATQTYVTNAVNNVIDAAPGALDTLNELAAAIGDDANFSATITAQIASKLDSAQAIATITGSDLDMNGNKVLFGNVYTAQSDLPSASSYHGMFAHVHNDGAGYFAHAGNWIRLANQSEIPSVIDSAGISSIITADVDQAFVNGLGISGGGVDSAGISSIITADVDAAFVTNLGFTAGGGAATSSDGLDTTYVYTATAGQTAFTGSDDNSVTLSYTANSVMVYLNGILLIPTTDYTATDGNTVTLVSGAAVNDELMIVTVKSGPKTWTAQSGNYTATAGDKLFIDVSSNTATVTLPASPTMGDEVRVIDATGNCSTNNITINRNSNNINGAADNLVLDVNRSAIGLAYYNSTQGWVLIER
jgi:hypothetical protein